MKLALPTGKLAKLGLGLCVGGLLIALTGLLPAVVPHGSFPWPVFVGSAVYIPGAFLAFFGCDKNERRQVATLVRIVRMGFFVVLVAAIVSFSR